METNRENFVLIRNLLNAGISLNEKQKRIISLQVSNNGTIAGMRDLMLLFPKARPNVIKRFIENNFDNEILEYKERVLQIK